MKLSLERQIPLAFIVALLLLATIGFFSYRQVTKLIEKINWEKHTQEVLLKLDEALSLVVDAEASGRGFIISGDENFLESFNHINQTIGGNLDQLRNLTADNPAQTERISKLESLITKRLVLLSHFTDLRRRQGLDAVVEQSQGQGKVLMDQIRGLIVQMKDTEENLLRQRESDLNDTINRTYGVIVLGSLAGIFSLALANLAIFRETGKLSKAEEDLRNTNRNLESRVGRRTSELTSKNEQLEEQIKKRVESEERRAVALEAGSLGTWKLNPDKDDGEMDELSLTLFGLSAADFKGTSKQAFSRVIEEDAPQLNEKLHGSITNREKFQTEFRIRDCENLIRWTQCTGTAQFDDQGNFTHIVGFCRDITENKEMELALRRNESFVRAILDSLPAHIAVLDKNGTIVEVNRAWNHFAAANCVEGKVASTGIGQNYLRVCENSDAFEEDTKKVLDNLKAILNGERKEFSFEYPCHSPNEERWFILQVSAMEDGAVVSHIDISERRKHEAERERLFVREQAARKDAEIANRLRDEFLATVSHELRAPLNSILGWARLMQQGKLDEKTSHKAIDTIVRNADAQNHLIEDLLDVSRIISGKLRLEVMTVKPNIFVESALETVRPAAEAKNIALEVREDTGISHISGDPNRLQQVVWNLLSNAIKFTPNDGRVTVEIERVDDHIEIRVKDTGVGIREEFLPHVFDRFSQADTSSIRKFGGLGLGLAIVRHLTEMHGGTVHVRSAGENQGSTFIVELPIVLSPPEDATVININQPFLKSENNLRLDGLLILAVDDEEDTRQLLAQSLTHYGATVTTANSAETALQAVNAQKPDVLISDIGMPDEDGYSLIRKVRALDINIPAVALTAFTRAQDRMRALAAGFQSHVAKPVEPEELATVVASLTGRLHANENDAND